MPHPAVNTKVETVVESFEALAIACAESVTGGGGRAAFDKVAQARTECTDALRGFLQPTLRLVSSE